MNHPTFRPYLFVTVIAVLSALIGACSKSSTDSKGDYELEASALSHEVILTWSKPDAANFNVFVSSDKDCDFANYSRCADGAMIANVTSPYTVKNLENLKAYYFRVEAVSGNAISWSLPTGARPNTIAFNAPVSAIAPSANGVVYLGGEFTRMGAASGGGVVFDGTRALAVLPEMPFVDGVVDSALADGKGGWFISGTFTSVGGLARKHIAHIMPNGQVDPGWTQSADNVSFHFAARSPNNEIVYVTESHLVEGKWQNQFLARNATTGETAGWNPTIDGEIWGAEVSSDTIFIYGTFTSVNGQVRNRLAAFDLKTGELTPWRPAPDGDLRGLKVINNSAYIFGLFTHVGSEARNGLAALDATTGSATSWNPNPDGEISTLTVALNNVYVSGNYNRYFDRKTNRMEPRHQWFRRYNGSV